MRHPFLAVVVLALAFASGCGFHMRGRTPLPEVMAHPYVDASDRFSVLYAALLVQLRAAGATPVSNAAEASGIIRLHVDSTGREILSVTADNKPGEYEVFYTAEFSVMSGATELLPRQRVRLTRDYGYDETAVLAKEHEEQSLRIALAEEIAALILRRLAAL
jgi:LPS-assembly lipoprotein